MLLHFDLQPFDVKQCVGHCQKCIFYTMLVIVALWIMENNTRGCSRFVQPTVEVSYCSQLQVCVRVCISVFVCMQM